MRGLDRSRVEALQRRLGMEPDGVIWPRTLDAIEAALDRPKLVYPVRCIDSAGSEMVHIFSTPEKAAAWAAADPREHVISDYVLDEPERAERAFAA